MCLYTGREMLRFYQRVRKTFDFDENTEAIDLTDIFRGPANIVAQPSDLFNRAMLRANGLREGGRYRDEQEGSNLLNSVI